MSRKPKLNVCLGKQSQILGPESTALPVSIILFEIKAAPAATNFWSWLMWITPSWMEGTADL